MACHGANFHTTASFQFVLLSINLFQITKSESLISPTHLVVLHHALSHWILCGTAAQCQSHHPLSSSSNKINCFSQRRKAGLNSVGKIPTTSMSGEQGSLLQNGRTGMPYWSSFSFFSFSPFRSSPWKASSMKIFNSISAPAYLEPHSYYLFFIG